MLAMLTVCFMNIFSPLCIILTHFKFCCFLWIIFFLLQTLLRRNLRSSGDRLDCVLWAVHETKYYIYFFNAIVLLALWIRVMLMSETCERCKDVDFNFWWGLRFSSWKLRCIFIWVDSCLVLGGLMGGMVLLPTRKAYIELSWDWSEQIFVL